MTIGVQTQLLDGRDESGMPIKVHAQALCESTTIGDRTRVWAFAHVMPGAVVGADCNICDHCYIEGGVTVGDRVTLKNGVLVFDGVTIEDEVFVGPGVVFTNDLRPRVGFKKAPADFLPTLIGHNATLGANCVVVCGHVVGHHAFVAAGSVVASDVPPHALVAGNPARPIGLVCVCGGKLDDALECACGRGFEVADLGLALLPA